MKRDIDLESKNSHGVREVNARLFRVESAETQLELFGPATLPIVSGDHSAAFQWYTFRRLPNRADSGRGVPTLHNEVNSLLVLGDFRQAKHPLVRIHSGCQTGETFGSQRCDCGAQLEYAKRLIMAEGCGAIFYMASQEGRNIGLWSKAQAYLLQEGGLDTFAANTALGYPEDAREYRDVSTLLKHFLVADSSVRLITNNLVKIESLKSHGVKIHLRVSMPVFSNEHNIEYLEAKAKSGQAIEL